MAKFCTKCGATLDDLGNCPKCGVPAEAPKTEPMTVEKKEKFCTKCGAENDNLGNCPKCDACIEAPKTEPPTEPKKKAGKKAKKVVIITTVVLAVYTVLLLTFGILTFFDKVKIPFLNDAFVFMGWKEEKVEEIPLATETPEDNGGNVPTPTPDGGEDEDYKVEFEDADEYFRNNSTVESEIFAPDSDSIRTGTETFQDLTERGFTQNSIITNYNMDGKYKDDEVIGSHSSSQHPMYQTIYTTPAGVVWQISAVNGDVMACRFSGDMSKGFFVSEKPTLTSYDNIKNKFYVNTPKASLAEVKQVSRVDAQTLDSLN